MVGGDPAQQRARVVVMGLRGSAGREADIEVVGEA